MDKRLLARPRFILLAVLTLALLVCAAIPPRLVSGHTPNRVEAAQDNGPPDSQHRFGTDHLGRDVLARIISAARIDLGVAVTATLAAFFIGTALGAAAGFTGGVVDGIVMRLMEILQSIPGILLGLMILVLAGTGFNSLVIAITLINIPIYARLTRAEVLPLANSPVVSAAKLSLVPSVKILSVYVLPGALTSALAYLPVQAGFSISVAAGFGFIGVGIQPPQAEWGTMIREGLSGLLFLNVWWPVVFPVIFLALSVLVLYGWGNVLMRRSG
jgi:peptide/nickel transport system permease protein